MLIMLIMGFTPRWKQDESSMNSGTLSWNVILHLPSTISPHKWKKKSSIKIWISHCLVLLKVNRCLKLYFVWYYCILSALKLQTQFSLPTKSYWSKTVKSFILSFFSGRYFCNGIKSIFITNTQQLELHSISFIYKLCVNPVPFLMRSWTFFK